MITIGQDAKTVYGWGKVAKVNAKSLIVTVEGQNHKMSMVQYNILNRDTSHLTGFADPMHY